MSVSRGPAAEDLVYLDWFEGSWACTVSLVSAEAGAGGEKALEAVLPPAAAALRASAGVAGTEKGRGGAICRWTSTSPDVNGVSAGFAVEEAGGICSGTVAAVAAVAGPEAKVRKVSGEDTTWDVTAPGISDKWRLVANGAVAQPDEADANGFRVNEAFDVEAPPAAGGKEAEDKVLAVVRVTTQYKRVPVDGAAAPAGRAGAYALQALQTAAIFAPPATPGGDPGSEVLAVYKSVLLFSALKSKTPK